MVFWKSKKAKEDEKVKTENPPPGHHVHGPNCQHGHDHHHDHHQHNHNHNQSHNPAANQQLEPGINQIKNVIAIASGKGGVGKSTVTSNLAFALAQQGFKVGVMDADIYGPSQTTLMGSQEEKAKGKDGHIIPIKRHGISFVSMGSLIDGDGPVVWRAPMANKILQQFVRGVLWGELDYLLIDLPPGTGDVQITLAQQVALSGAIIVTTPQELASQIAKKGLLMFNQVNVPILGIIENMSGFICSHCGDHSSIFGHGGGKKLAESFHVPFLGSIPLDPELMEASEKGLSVLQNHPQAASTKALGQVVAELQKNIHQQKQNHLEPLQYGIDPDTGDVLVEWTKEHMGVYPAYHLRLQCSCANCIDETTGKKILDPKKVPLDIKAEAIGKVGRYGLTVHFSDHHNTGIYKLEKLQEMCECAGCLQKKAQEKSTETSFSV